MRRLFPLVLATLAVSGCVDDGDASLSELGLFVGELKKLQPADGVVPYTVVSPLFSDFAGKERFIVLPDGESIAFTDGEDWTWPEGTTVVKNFFFDLDRRDPDEGEFSIIETRLLELGPDGWEGSTYVWNEEQTDAYPLVEGDRITIEFTDENGDASEQEYEIPNLDHCASCHGRDDELHLLGPFTHQLNYDVQRDGATVNQLSWMEEQGMFDQALPPPADLPAMVDPYGGGDLELRARSYLHANCSHCHRAGGGAGVSGLSFPFWEDRNLHLGICKIPAAAGAGTGGHSYDIVPGAPDDSIAVFRIESLDPDIKMPELPTRLLNPDGIQLIREWISAMPADDCGG